MRISLIIISFLFSTGLFAQVGINTKEPLATLDINGTFRIQDRTSSGLVATKIMGVNDDGVFVEVVLDDNLFIEDNKIKFIDRNEEIFSFGDIGSSSINNMPNIIWPGAAGNGRSVIRIENSAGDLTITGIDTTVFTDPMDAHGYKVKLYSVDGRITLISGDAGSLSQNQFQIADDNTLNVKQYEIVQLMYDGILEKWLILSRH